MDSHDSSSHNDPSHAHPSNERRFHGGAERLRRPERLALMELPQVVALSLDGLSAASMLDVGTGTGVLAEAFAPHIFEISGMDINPEFLLIARQHVPGGRFVEGRAEAIPFPEQSFDVTVLGHVLHETDDALVALQEAHRVTRLRVVVLEWPYAEGPHGPPLNHRLPAEVIEDLARGAGFSRIDTFPLTHMVLYRLEK